MQNKSIEELEDDYWQAPKSFATKLVEKIYLLRKYKINDLDFEDLRLLISQNVGLNFLIPKIIDKLKAEPLFEAFSYPGDLLSATINIDVNYWSNHSTELDSIIAILKQAKMLLSNLAESDEVDEELRNSINIFLNKNDK